MNDHCQLILSRLDGVRGREPKWMAKCPAHEDRHASLSIRLNDNGKVAIHCFTGCSGRDIMRAINLGLSALYPDGERPKPKPKPMTKAEFQTWTTMRYASPQYGPEADAALDELIDLCRGIQRKEAEEAHADSLPR